MLPLSPFPLLPSGEVSCCHRHFATAVPLLPPLLQEIQRIFLLGYHRYLKSGFSRYHCYFKFKSYRSSASLPLVPLL